MIEPANGLNADSCCICEILLFSGTAAVNSWTDIEETSDHFAHAVS